MDYFGIGSALQAVARVYFQCARRSGRTTALIESLREGDRVVCANEQEAARLRKLIREKWGNNLTFEVITVPVDMPDRLYSRGPSKGRTIFEHTWVEAYYQQALSRAGKDIGFWQREASGRPAPPVQPIYHDMRWLD